MRRGIIATAFILAAATSVEAQQPSIASAWATAKLTKEECLSKGEEIFQRLKFKRIESIGFTTYSDFGQFQIGLRCVPDHGIVFIFGGGPGQQDKALVDLVDRLKKEFD